MEFDRAVYRDSVQSNRSYFTYQW